MRSPPSPVCADTDESLTARTTNVPSGPAQPIKTSPAGCPSCESGPATPVSDTAHVEWQTFRVPAAIAAATSSQTTPWASISSWLTLAKSTFKWVVEEKRATRGTVDESDTSATVAIANPAVSNTQNATVSPLRASAQIISAANTYLCFRASRKYCTEVTTVTATATSMTT